MKKKRTKTNGRAKTSAGRMAITPHEYQRRAAAMRLTPQPLYNTIGEFQGYVCVTYQFCVIGSVKSIEL